MRRSDACLFRPSPFERRRYPHEVRLRGRSPDGEGKDTHLATPIEWRRAALGVRLVELRRAAGLTQKQLAERLGVRHPTISRFETGHDMPTSEMLVRIADALSLSESARQELEDRLAELRIEVRAARLLLRQGVRAVQRQVGEREARATSVWSYHLALVPGLLQTADYTRAMATVVDPEIEVDVDALSRPARSVNASWMTPPAAFASSSPSQRCGGGLSRSRCSGLRSVESSRSTRRASTMSPSASFPLPLRSARGR